MYKEQQEAPRLNILLVGDYSPEIGGVARYVESLKESLADRGHEVTVFHTTLGKDEKINNVYRLPRTIIGRLQLILPEIFGLMIKLLIVMPQILLKPRYFVNISCIYSKARKLMRYDAFHIIHSMHLSPRSLAVLLAANGRLPTVVTALGSDIPIPHSIFDYVLRKTICNKADALTVLTEAKSKFLCGLYGKSFAVVRNFIPLENTYLERISSRTKLFVSKREAKLKLGFNTNDLLILFPSRLVKEKGIHELIEASTSLASNRDSKNKTKLIITGDGPEKESLIAKIKRKHLETNVMLMLGLDKNKLYLVYAAADIYALPTYWPETLPISLIEAMAHGLPIIITNFEGVGEAVVDSYNGFIIKPRNIASLRCGLEKLLNDKLRHQIAWNSYRTYLQKFESRAVIPYVEKKYREILA